MWVTGGGCFARTFAGVKGQSQWGSVQDSQQDVLLNKLLLYSITSVDLRLQLTSAVLCRDLQTDDNALLCGLHWIWQNHIHTRSFSSSLDRTHPLHLNGQHHSCAQPEMEQEGNENVHCISNAPHVLIKNIVSHPCLWISPTRSFRKDLPCTIQLHKCSYSLVSNCLDLQWHIHNYNVSFMNNRCKSHTKNPSKENIWHTVLEVHTS